MSNYTWDGIFTNFGNFTDGAGYVMVGAAGFIILAALFVILARRLLQ